LSGPKAFRDSAILSAYEAKSAIDAETPGWASCKHRLGGHWYGTCTLSLGRPRPFPFSAKEHWGELTDNDLDVISGNREKLVGKLQEHYGYAKEQAQRVADDWLKSVKEPVHSQAQRASGGQQTSSEQHAGKR
jgi:uncharacterized protein YjbJ (UPF0337 family)